MEESSTYQAIMTQGLNRGLSQGLSQGLAQGISQGLEQGRAEKARRMLILIGEKRLGIPSPLITATLNTIAMPERL